MTAVEASLDGMPEAWGGGRVCAWCQGPIPVGARRDAETCSKRCRQARHRFTRAAGRALRPGAAGEPRRLAYADPPYPGKAWIYREHADYAGEVDHEALVDWLTTEHDAWALSTSAEALPRILALCPPGSRVAAWVRGWRPNKAATIPLNAWEPVIYGGQIIRRPDPSDASPTTTATRRAQLDDANGLDWFAAVAPFFDDAADEPSRVATGDASPAPGSTPDLDDQLDDEDDGFAGDDVSCLDRQRRVDALVYRARPRTTDPNRVIGAKPAEFCRWVFDLIAATDVDELVDVFPGSGGVSRAWEAYAGKPAIRGDRSW